MRKTPQWWVKLGDFGITKRIDSEHTALRTRVGTPRYLAPEVEDDDSCDSEYTNAVDIWSLGCVLYHMLAQEPPFKTASSKKKPLPEDVLMARASPDAADFVRALLSKDPAKRPTAQDALANKWFMSANDSLVRHSYLSARAMPTADTEVTHPNIQNNFVPEISQTVFDVRDTSTDQNEEEQQSLVKKASTLEIAETKTLSLPTVNHEVLSSRVDDEFKTILSRKNSAEVFQPQDQEGKEQTQEISTNLGGWDGFLVENSERTTSTSFPNLTMFGGRMSDGAIIPPRDSILSSVRSITLVMDETVDMATSPLKFSPRTRMTTREFHCFPVRRYSWQRDKDSEAIEFKSVAVSRKHCTITYWISQWWIKDEGSSSGTYLEGERLSGPGMESDYVRLKNQSRVQLGTQLNWASLEKQQPVRFRVLLDE